MNYERQKCIRCKMNLTLDKFKKKRDDTYQKMCNECLDKAKINREKNKCEHNRVKSRCKECKGASICEHNRVKSSCKECGGSSICEHNRRKSRCKECKGASICEHNRLKSQCKECSNPVKITIQKMIYNSKQYDKKYDIYDPVNFIDYCFVENLLDDYKHCYYQDCKVELQIMERKDNLATIERLDNSLGHIKSNCVICCWKCNYSKKSNNQ